MGANEVRQFLDYLVDEHNISYTTYIHALCALLFIYKKVLKTDIGWIDNGPMPTCPRKPTKAKSGSQIEIPLSPASTEQQSTISSLPPGSRTKNKIGQTHFYVPGSTHNCHVI